MGGILKFLRIAARLLVATFIFANLATAITCAYAAESGLSIDKNKPVEMIADSLTVDDLGQNAVFSGDVQVIQGDIRLNAQRVTVYYQRGRQESKTQADGASPFSAGSQIKLIKASGGTTLFSAKERLKGREMTYDLNSGIVTVTGGVTLSNENGTLRGEKIIFEVKNKKASIFGGKSGRVRGLALPIQNKN